MGNEEGEDREEFTGKLLVECTRGKNQLREIVQYSQQESKTSDGWKDKATTVNAPYCYSEMSPIIDCVHGSTNRDMQHLEDLLDYKAYESEKFQLHDRKSLPQTYSRSSSTTTSTKSSCQSNAVLPLIPSHYQQYQSYRMHRTLVRLY
ncbi:Hypothetical predicted protein [Octopus vulgaris]|uniref:Uncharacterized protein n=1 Tax=Octopus vulgaris TaxID=6645 RepID=A0AA36BE76_OCTVU|nr:Hypothetical predicted protein [Octopus vulgaris]